MFNVIVIYITNLYEKHIMKENITEAVMLSLFHLLLLLNWNDYFYLNRNRLLDVFWSTQVQEVILIVNVEYFQPTT